MDYFTVKEGQIFHIFDAQEVIKTIDESVKLVNSKASQTGQMNDQKVVFKLINADVTIGEIEMRNDSQVHYREIKFWMEREKTLRLLKTKIKPIKQKFVRIIAYGQAVKKFKFSD